MSEIRKKIISVVLVISTLFSLSVSAVAFDTSYLDEKGVKLGYSIINGYSKLALKNTDAKSYKQTAVYLGLDITNAGLLMNLGWFYITKGVDLERILVDNDYAVSKFTELDKFAREKGYKNPRAEAYRKKLESQHKKIYTSLDTVGLYIFECSRSDTEKILNSKDVDAVLAGGRVPQSMKDINLDGKSDHTDARYIQKYIAGQLSYKDADESEYIKYACDIDGDKSINITDATLLQYVK